MIFWSTRCRHGDTRGGAGARSARGRLQRETPGHRPRMRRRGVPEGQFGPWSNPTNKPCDDPKTLNVGFRPLPQTTRSSPRGARYRTLAVVPERSRPGAGPCVREERPTDISQCCEAGRMTLGYLRVCASQRRSRRKTLHFNLLRNPRPTTTVAGRVVLPVSTGVAEFERPLIAIRTEEGRRTARAPDVPFDRRPELRPDQRTLAR